MDRQVTSALLPPLFPWERWQNCKNGVEPFVGGARRQFCSSSFDLDKEITRLRVEKAQREAKEVEAMSVSLHKKDRLLEMLQVDLEHSYEVTDTAIAKGKKLRDLLNCSAEDQLATKELARKLGEALEAFEAKYLPYTYQDTKLEKFLKLEQGKRSVYEYEQEFGELARHVGRGILDSVRQRLVFVMVMDRLVSLGRIVQLVKMTVKGLDLDRF
ncbi:Retrotransposon gag domain [Dillenia turbinata]|uniref:Retrotransposon gag domain n=1 Tax=Dillenia turbinata TaxID=194707 RepID=A0AAN8V6U4_9MAGN